MSRTIETLKNQVKDMHSALVTDIYQSLRDDPEWKMELQDMIYYNDFSYLNNQMIVNVLSPAEINRVANAREKRLREEEQEQRRQKAIKDARIQRANEKRKETLRKKEEERQRQLQIRQKIKLNRWKFLIENCPELFVKGKKQVFKMRRENYFACPPDTKPSGNRFLFLRMRLCYHEMYNRRKK